MMAAEQVAEGAAAELLQQLDGVVREAGRLILQIYHGPFAVQHKADASPVTEADELAERHIVAALRALRPQWPVVAEEAVARDGAPPVAGRFWLVDPLDGTKEFVAGNGEFTVNVALIERGLPVLGLVYLPVTDRLFTGAAGLGAWETAAGAHRRLHGRPTPVQGLTLACSRSHGDEPALQAWQQGLRIAGRVVAGSSLKFGLLAAGQADVYPRFGRTMEWDTAAGHAVLAAAGGHVQDLAGQALRYGKPGYENPGGFVAWARS